MRAALAALFATDRRRGAWLIVLVCLLFLPYKIEFGREVTDTGMDGGYYTDVARHVRDGQGLSTGIDLYHQGLPRFPHPTAIYPIWPLVLGYTARVLPLDRLLVALPSVLFFTSLLAGWLWGRRVFPRPLWPQAFPGFDAGHAFALVLGFQWMYFRATSRPYTEGLAYTILLLGLWRAHSLLARPGLRAGAELGVWFALAFMTRAQLLVAALAMACVLPFALAFGGDRRAVLRMAAGFAACFALPVLPWYLHVDPWVQGGTLNALLRFDEARATDVLSVHPQLYATDGVLEWLKDRGRGLLLAFRRWERYAYADNFYWWQYSLVAALPFAAVEAVRRVRTAQARRESWAWLTGAEALPWLFLVTFAIGAFTSVQIVHKSFYTEWWFSTRHAVICIFLFFLCWMFLTRRRSFWGGVLAVSLLVGTAAHGQRRLAMKTRQETAASKLVHEPVRRWIADKHEKDADLVIAFTGYGTQLMAPRTPGVNYRWVSWKTTQADLVAMFDVLGTDYLVANKESRKWPFRRPAPAFAERFRKVADVGGFQVFERAAPTAAVTPATP